GPAVVVGVEPGGGERRAVAAAGAGGRGHVLELPAAEVPEQVVRADAAAAAVEPALRLPMAERRDVEVDPAVTVVVGHGHPRGAGGEDEAGRHRPEDPALVAVDPVAEDQVLPPVAVKIGEGGGAQ